MWCTAAEPKSHRIGSPVARQQRPAAELVALPLADLGRGEVADVVDVEHQQRAEVGLLQRLLDAREPVAVQPAVIDALLEIDPHDAERRQRAAPVVARVDVLGADFVGFLLPWPCSLGVQIVMRIISRVPGQRSRE